jgi:hypothetical protein
MCDLFLARLRGIRAVSQYVRLHLMSREHRNDLMNACSGPANDNVRRSLGCRLRVDSVEEVGQ